MSLVSVETNFTFDKQPNCEIFPSPRTESTGAQVSPASTRRVRAWKFHMCVLAVNLHACVWSVLGNSTMKQNGIDAANLFGPAVETHLTNSEIFSKSSAVGHGCTGEPSLN